MLISVLLSGSDLSVASEKQSASQRSCGVQMSTTKQKADPLQRQLYTLVYACTYVLFLFHLD
jgi:hypothetical protein